MSWNSDKFGVVVFLCQVIKELSDVKVMSKSLGTLGIGGMVGKIAPKYPLFGIVGTRDTNHVAEWE